MARPRLVCLVLALVTLLVYLPVWHHGFVLYDDPDYVTDNRMVQAGLTWAGVKWAFTTWHASNWHPLTWLSHMLDCELFGLNAGAQHLVNVLLHAANSVLILCVLFRLTGALWTSVLTAALFAWHPLHVESVAWIAERKDLLSAFFWWLTLWAYARYAQSRSRVEGRESGAGAALPALDPRPSILDYFLALLFFVLGLMAKPMVVTLPFVLLLLDYWPLGRVSGFELRVSGSTASVTQLKTRNTKLGTLLWEKSPFFLLAAASCVVTYLAQRGEPMVAFEQYPFGLRLGNALVSYVGYLWKTIWPAHLAVIYPLRSQVAWWEIAASALALVVITSVAWLLRRRAPQALVGWLWFLGTLVPVIGLVQVGSQAMADRYTYIPLVGIFIAVVFGARQLLSRLQVGFAAPAFVSGLVLAGCVFATERQLRFWRDSESLFAHAVEVTKHNPVAHVNLGVAFEQQGRREDALAQYQEALRLDPRLAQAHNNLGNLLDEMGKPEQALAQYREAVRLKPNAPLAHVNLGSELAQLGQYDEAMREYVEAARLDPGDPRPRYLMGKALLRKGHDAEAIVQLHEALRLNPNDFQTLTYLARVLAAGENPQIRNGAEAVALAERANTSTDGQQPFVLDTLAAAYAEAGRFKDAQQAEQQAVELAAAAGETETNAMQTRLKLYQSGRPYREAFTSGAR